MTSQPRSSSVSMLLGEAAMRHPQRTALDCGGRRRSYARLQGEVAAVAQGLLDLGVRPGHRVAVIAGMTPESVVAFHAVLRIGAIAVIIDPESTARELRRSFEDHSAIVAIAARESIPTLLELPADVQPKAIVAIDPPPSPTSRFRGIIDRSRAVALRMARQQGTRSPAQVVIDWRELVASLPLSAEHRHPEPEDLALLQYTSAADGSLLGAMLTHENLTANAHQIQEFWQQDSGVDAAASTETGEILCSTIPLHEESGASLSLVAPLAGGQQLVLASTPEAVVESARRGPVTVLVGTTTLLTRAAALADASRRPRPIARRVTTVPLGLTDEIAAAWLERLGRPLDVAYARAECGVSLAGPCSGSSPVDAGRPLSGVRVEIADDGELSIRGPQVFHGYWNRPDETAAVLTGNGWFRTGDAAWMADDGAVRVELQRGTILTADSRAVSPQEVASTFMGHEDVIAAAVYGEPDRRGGEEVHARIVLRPEAEVSADEIRVYAKQRLSAWKLPQVIDLIVASPEHLRTEGSPGRSTAPATEPGTD